MLKYIDAKVTFAEVPNEITLCILISNCPNKCKNCHSQYLRKDKGTLLDLQHLTDLIDCNTGISCVCLMGGDANPEDVDYVAESIKDYYPELKVAWYSGKDWLSDKVDIHNFDYIKIGRYDESFGPLDIPTTNQIFYAVEEGKLHNQTYKFWRKGKDDENNY